MKIRKSTLSDESDVKALWGYCFEPPTDPFCLDVRSPL